MESPGALALSKYYFKRLFKKPTEAKDIQKELEEYRKKIGNLQAEIKLLLSWRDRYSATLTTLTESTQTFVWSKDEFGYYTLANARHCNSFFGFIDSAFCLNYIVGKNDTELLNEAKEQRNIRSSFGAICELSDIYTKKKKKICHFLEAGIVNDEEVLLYVVKMPRLDDDGKFIGSVGVAWNFTSNSEYMVKQLNRMIYDKKATKLFKCDKVFAYAIEPSMKKCSVFQHICAGQDSDCPHKGKGCIGECDVRNRLEESQKV